MILACQQQYSLHYIEAAPSKNHQLSNALKHCEQYVQQGFNFSASLKATQFFPNEYKHLILIAEESGRLSELLAQLALQHQQQQQTLTTQLCTLIEPLALILISLTIAIILIAIYLPIFRMGMVL